uniref:Uncharacterized protein n=1 Tax=Balaenoptera musculus TaxID=9771 RepID=A0A8C0CIX6_BALMU
IQSREPSGSRAAKWRCGWRPRGVPTPSGDCGPGAARQAARRGAGGTAGQQRPLQVPGVEPASFPTRAFGSPATVLPPAESPSRSGPGSPERSEAAGSYCYFLDPLAPLPEGPRPRMPRYRFRQSPLIIPCWYKKRLSHASGLKDENGVSLT